MIRVAALLFLAMVTGGCVSGDNPSNGAIRVLHAVSDGPRMNLYFNGGLQAAGFDYRAGSAYLAVPAAQYSVRIDELLPSAANPNTRTIPGAYQSQNLGVNDEVTLVIVGQAASQTEEVLQIVTTTRGVPTAQTRLQFVHAAVGPGPSPVDIYVVAPDTEVTINTPKFAADLAYKGWTGQSEVTGGNAKVVVTAAGDPADVLLESPTIFLTLGGTLLVAVVNNTGLDKAQHPFQLVLLTGSGSGVVPDTNSPANLRLVNASPGTYSLDAFVNATSVDATARQACDPLPDPLPPDAETFVVRCALPYGSVGPFDALTPGTYGIKIQESDPATVTANTFQAGLIATGQLTTLITGLVSDTATATDVTPQSLLATRRIATAAQLRLVDVSLAGDAAVAADPTTDLLQIFITPACADLAEEDPDYAGVRKGFDTGYVSYVGGDYQLTVTLTDTAATAPPPQVLLSQRVSLLEGGIYTLLIADTTGGVQPLKYLSLDDNPSLADCPAPP